MRVQVAFPEPVSSVAWDGRVPYVTQRVQAGQIVNRLTCFLILRGVERGDIGLHAELHAGRLARPLDDHAVIAVRLLQEPS